MSDKPEKTPFIQVINQVVATFIEKQGKYFFHKPYFINELVLL